MDNLASEKQQRLLVSSLYSSLENEIFLAAANVGIYYIYGETAIVPDVFISFDVQVPGNLVKLPKLSWNLFLIPKDMN